ncbi:MAG: thioredoxin [Leptospiraceae bacterium]|nr:thioredoxin [Leptospiraceae bacterium]
MSGSLPPSFDDLLATHNKPILVDFWAEWCAPCKIVAPELVKLSQELGDKLTIIKVNVDEKPHLAQRYGISGIPTLVLFKNGREVQRFVGAASAAQIKKQFEMFF